MLPLLLIGAALFGAGRKAADGYSTSTKADEVAAAATIRLQAAQARLDRVVKTAEAAFTRLERDRAQARALLTTEIAPALIRVARVEDGGFDALNDALSRPDKLAAILAAAPGGLISVAGGAVKGLSAGFALGGMSASGVMAFGTASTGTAISGLSGAAATNATLAWLGGGSLASGGLGMAGGAAVVGGIVAAPAMLLAGLAYANRAEKRLTQATAYEGEVTVAIAEGQEAEARVGGVKRRVNEIARTIKDVAERCRVVLARLNARLDMLPPNQIRFEALPPPPKADVAILSVLGGLLNELIHVAIIDESARLLNNSDAVLKRAENWKDLGRS